MDKSNFNSIVEGLLKKQIAPEQARVLFDQLKAAIPTGGKTAGESKALGDDIAIIGLAGQFPDADNIYSFWNNLLSGHDAVRELPKTYLDQTRCFSPEPQAGKTYCKWGGILADRDCFDPLFFNISPAEAESMNPHQRLILQESWKALEDAGINPKTLAGSKTGTFIGAEPTGYFHHSFTGYSDAIIASRLAYYLDLQGPALVVNTGCSSSAAALHLACESLRQGESSLALAGGVHAYLNQDILCTLSAVGMLSPRGKCQAFDDAADGTVLSEGVGVVVLKRLDRALADGNRIYGVIVGSGMNQDGSSNGITAPNGLAQERLLIETYTRYGIDPRHISYIEAHGTGTKLGDPVEANALIRAFRKFTGEVGYCAVGSAKSHIGHTGAAAGVIGLIKLVLSMRYRRFPGLLNFQRLNSLIEFDGSPFYIPTATREWSSVNGTPRLAGLSSFGHSGTNVHLVVREYICPADSQPAHNGQPVLIPLSARNPAGLRVLAGRLAAFLREADPAPALADIAYTLQNGREAMAQRAALIVRDGSELRDKLEALAAGRADIEDGWQGQLNEANPSLHWFDADEDLRTVVQQWIKKGKLHKIADIWSQGAWIDWRLVQTGRYVSLPTYPFAQTRYWRSETARPATAESGRLHPLLHRNTSDFSAQRFSSTFTGEEFFLADHVVQGQRVLPGAAYLDMTRAAIVHSLGKDQASGKVLRLQNMVWTRPIIAGPVQVSIELSSDTAGGIAYTFSSLGPGHTEPMLNSQGSAVLRDAVPPDLLDIAALRAQCTRPPLDADPYYAAFQAMGIAYGPSHRGIAGAWVGEGLVIAKLVLPPVVADTADQFVLHPSVLDAAFQAAIGLWLADSAAHELRAALPFALESLDLYGDGGPETWAVIRARQDATLPNSLSKLDIDLCDSQGRVWVRIGGLTSRPLARDSEPTDILMLEPYWQAQALPAVPLAPAYARRWLWLCGLEGYPQEFFTAAGFDCLTLDAPGNTLDERFQNQALRAIEALQTLLSQSSPDLGLVQAVVPQAGENRVLAALSGLLKTAQREYPRLVGQVIEIEPDTSPAALLDRLRDNACSPKDAWIRYTEGQRWVSRLREIELSPARPPWQDRSVYLITGGAGGLGQIFAQEIAQQVTRPAIILTGRSPLNADIQAQLDRLTERGAEARYLPTDISQPAAVATLIQNIRDEFGRIDGILHAAGILRDSLIPTKTPEQLRQVLAPKVAGLVNLDRETRDLPLDCFILFASGSGVLGNVGQADYALANAFLDAYAHYRNELVAAGLRHGRTLSMDWPLWQAGGMGADDRIARAMPPHILPMASAQGFQALYRSLASAKTQVLVLAGQVAPLREMLGLTIESPTAYFPPPAPELAPDPSATTPSAAALTLVKQALATTIKLSAEHINPATHFDKYGIDSISQVAIIRALEKHLGDLPKTLLFEYSTAHTLADYLAAHHAGRLMPHPAPLAPKPEAPAAPKPQVSNRLAPPPETVSQDIAIIGLAGRYPLADTLEAFWENLCAGRNCITEAPPERWQTSLLKTLRGSDTPPPTAYGGFLRDIHRFDQALFEIPPDQVWELAPELRLFLEIAWETFEDAGYTRPALREVQNRSRTGIGVFVGSMYQQYPWSIPAPEHAARLANGTDWQIANRVSHYFDLLGPSIAVNSACSSALTAIHLACESLRQKTCTMALAGGVNLSLDPSKYEVLRQTRFLGSGNTSKSFGVGDGYLPGEGVGAVLLKPLDLALRDGDPIRAVIKSSFVCHGGGRQMYSAPDPGQQAELIIQSLERAGIDPATVGYVEAAANGSALGDPLEVVALKNAFARFTQQQHYCALGSVKSNLGHLEAASGISQLTKVILQLQHRTLVPTINATPRNPTIHLDHTPFVLQETLAPWPQWSDPATGRALPRRGMINSFGAGGAYANLIVEEFVAAPPVPTAQRPRPAAFLCLFSAKTATSLTDYLQRLGEYLRRQPQLDLEALVQALAQRNHQLEQRAAIVADSTEALAERLDWLRLGRSHPEAGAYLAFDTLPATGEPLPYTPGLSDPDSLARQFVAGATIHWHSGNGPSLGLDLPRYAFDHGLEFHFPAPDTAADDPVQPALITASYTFDQPLIRDHLVNQQRFLIGAIHASLALTAGFARYPDTAAIELDRLSFVKPIAVTPDQPVQVQVVSSEQNGSVAAQVLFRHGLKGPWHLTASGKLRAATYAGDTLPLARLQANLNEDRDIERLYRANSGVVLGASFKTIAALYTGPDQVLARLALPHTEENPVYALHPLLINSGFIAAAALLEPQNGDASVLPLGINRLYCKQRAPQPSWVYVTDLKRLPELSTFNFVLLDDHGETVAHAWGCSVKLAQRPSAQPASTDITPPADNLRHTVQDYLAGIIAQVSEQRIKEIKPSANLMQLGLESSQVVAAANAIEQDLQIGLYPTAFFEYPSISALSDFLINHHGAVLAAAMNKTRTSVSLAATPAPADTGSDSPHYPPDATVDSEPKMSPPEEHEAIAVIGMHGLFAQAENLEQFWENLKEGRNLISEIPQDHWDYGPWYDDNPKAQDKTYCKWGSFIADVDKFDAGFFNISPREAAWMDPQLRLMLQSIYATGEDAGYIPRLRGSDTGVFVGVCSRDYADKISEARLPMDPYLGTGNAPTALANRVSFHFDFKGPSLVLDTSCSSSLVALHTACRALRDRECSLAFVGGANLLLSSWHYRYFSSIGALSPTGRCHSFDAAADGYVPGEGIASLLLKPLSAAERDGDRIYAVIRGSAALHGGYTPSLTAPSVSGEENVILNAWKNASIDPRKLSYIEAHGTGTKLGDPVEIDALKKAFQAFPSPDQRCAVGSAKAHIGHTEGAAGIAGVLKVILQMQHRQFPPLPGFQTLNPYIQLEKSPLYINQTLADWPSPEGEPRLAGVSSFGFAGAYAHVVIEEYLGKTAQALADEATPEHPALIVLSAKTPDRLHARARQLLTAIGEQAGPRLTDIAYTLQTGREAMEERLALLAGSLRELTAKLHAFLAGHEGIPDLRRGRAKRDNPPSLADLPGDDQEPDATEPGWARSRQLMARWVHGAVVDWEALYPGRKPRRIALPVYPFAKERYWVLDTDAAPAAAPVPLAEPLTAETDTAPAVCAKPSGVLLSSLAEEPPLMIRAEPPSFPARLILPDALAPLPNTPIEPASPTPVTVLPATLHGELSGMLAKVLAMKPSDIDIDVKFAELGVDSIAGVEWIQALNNHYGTAIPANKVYDYPSLREFAGYLAPKLDQPTARLTDGSPPQTTAIIDPPPQVEPQPERAPQPASPADTPATVVQVHELEPGIFQITLQDTVHKNGFSPALAEGLQQAFAAITAQPACQVVILTGYDGYFASGGTQDGLLAIQEGRVKFTDTPIFSLPLTCPVPVIAAMQGHAIGAGWSLGMFCDFVILSRDSAYTSNYMHYGFTPGAGATLIFPEKFGTALAQEILFTGKQYRGSDFENRGVPFPILPSADVLPHALQLARQLARAPRESLVVLKDHMAGSLRERLQAACAAELQMHDRTFVNRPEIKQRIETLFNRSGRTGPTEPAPVQEAVSQPPRAVPSPPPAATAPPEAIAVIGMSGQFPKAANLAEFWENIAAGRDCISEIPASRWSLTDYYDPDPEQPGKTYGKWMGAVEDVDKFDPGFFRIPPIEACWMDPQQRLFLENCWHCFEDAGLSADALSASRCGVFVGCAPNDYVQQAGENGWNAQGFMGGSASILSARIAYYLNLKGPCLAIDTACSSSLVAIAEACNHLAWGGCDLALAGGVSIMAGPTGHIMTSKAGMLSPDGHCYSFDQRANGFVPGEGVGVVLLKRLADALRDQDPIYGVIRGWGVNQDGRTNGITAPSVHSQILLEQEVAQRFGIHPDTITLVEAHGTATKLGDPIEIEALTTAFRAFTTQTGYCALGAVKSNIGHTLAAAGVAGALKALLAVQHRCLPPTIHFAQLNENISLADSPFYINTRLQAWEPGDGVPRRVAVNSFGFSGTNAHIVIEEPPPLPAEPTLGAGYPVLFILSAHSAAQLQLYAGKLLDFLNAHASVQPADLAYTLQVGRTAMDYRLAYVADSKAALLDTLQAFSTTGTGVRLATAKTREQSPDRQALLDLWLAQRHLGQIASAWLEGAAIDWHRLYGPVRPRRIHLPTYPFAKESYWLPQFAEKHTAAAPQSPPAHRADTSRTTATLSPVAKPTGIKLYPLTEEGALHQPVAAPTPPAAPAIPVDITPPKAVRLDLPKISAAVLREELAESFAEALLMKRGDVELHKNFVAMGLDSILGVEWVRALNKKYGLSLMATRLYDYPTIHALADYLEQELNQLSTAAEVQPISVITPLENLLQQVQTGHLAVAEAEQLFHQLSL